MVIATKCAIRYEVEPATGQPHRDDYSSQYIVPGVPGAFPALVQPAGSVISFLHHLR